MKNYTMTKEKIKAIRTVKGFTSDLRKEIKHADRGAMYDFIDENAANLFGVDIIQKKHDENGVLSDEYEKMIYCFVGAVFTGKEKTYIL